MAGPELAEYCGTLPRYIVYNYGALKLTILTFDLSPAWVWT